MVNAITDVAGSGKQDQLRRQLQKKLDSIADTGSAPSAERGFHRNDS